MGYALIALGGIAVFALLALEAKKTQAAASIGLVSLPATGSTTSSGITATQQEEQSGIQEATGIGTNLATGNVVGAGVAAVSGLLTQLTQHSERLSDAKAENTAIPAAVEAFDADMAAINQAFNSGKATPAQVMAAMVAMQANIYNYLHGLVGKPGTAWSVPSGLSVSVPNGSQPIGGPGITCNKSCTASCCLFWDDLSPPIVVVWQAMQGITPGIDYQRTSNGFVLTVPEVYPPDDSAYGTYSRPLYTLTWEAPTTTPTSLVASII
jgi:hypothetical protein